VRLLPKTELLDGEIFYLLKEARVVIESWRRHYNAERPHGSLGYKPTAPEVSSPRGRLRNPKQLRRPRSNPGPQCANITTGPVAGG